MSAEPRDTADYDAACYLDGEFVSETHTTNQAAGPCVVCGAVSPMRQWLREQLGEAFQRAAWSSEGRVIPPGSAVS